MLIHHLLPSPRHSHTSSSISSFWVGKLGREMKTRLNRARPTTRRRRGARLARERETETERKRWCFWTCSSTGAAGDVCTRRTTASSEFGARKRERQREGEMKSVTWRYATRSSARREKKEREIEREKCRDSSNEGPAIVRSVC